MKSSHLPKFMPLPFATAGSKNDIPEAAQPGKPGAASLQSGFPDITMTSVLLGGVPPDGKDMNGVLYLLSLTARWVQLGGGFPYNRSFANDSGVNGYPKGATLLAADGTRYWFNQADDNTTDPEATDGSAQNWVLLNADWNADAGPGQILNKPNLAAVATSGSYADLTDKPAIPAAQVNADWNAASGVARILNKPKLAKVATSGDYNDLLNAPPAPVAQVNADWNATSGVARILNKPPLADVATTGSYADLKDKPTTVITAPKDNVGMLHLDLTSIREGEPEIFFDVSVGVDSTLWVDFVNPTEAGILCEFTVVIMSNPGSVILWPQNTRWPGGVAPTLTGIAGKLDTFVFYTQDGGETYCGFVAGRNQ